MDNREPIDRIEALVSSLPEGDARLAHEFLNSRNFESLQLLVDSSLVRVKKGRSKESPKEEYLKAIEAVCEETAFSGGKFADKFDKEFAEFEKNKSKGI